MSEFEVKVYPAVVEAHPDPETTALEIVRVGDFQTIVQKGHIKNGDKVAYIPEQAILPDGLLEEMELTGRLAGSKKNRVKAVKLRGIVSQGLAYPVKDYELGDDIQLQLGIIKHEPVLPPQLRGKVANAGGKTLNYDIENIKKFPDLFQPGERVVVTEKLHGTWACLGMYDGEPIVTSKGLSKQGIKLDLGKENANVYVQQWRNYGETLTEYLSGTCRKPTWYVLGEIFGKGVQDLHYGFTSPVFRVFDIWIGKPQAGHFLDWTSVVDTIEDISNESLQTVPVLYDSLYNRDVINTIANQDSALLNNHLREGVVITAVPERTDPIAGRAKLKHISDKYLLRKGNITEYA